VCNTSIFALACVLGELNFRVQSPILEAGDGTWGENAVVIRISRQTFLNKCSWIVFSERQKYEILQQWVTLGALQVVLQSSGATIDDASPINPYHFKEIKIS